MKKACFSFFKFLIPILILTTELFPNPNDSSNCFGIRQDGSELKGYLALPSDRKSFPLAILCQGSYCEESSTQSVYPFHQILAPLFNSAGIGMLSIEKKGVYREHFDAVVFHEYNLVENRVCDYLQVLAFLREFKPKGWDARLIFIGTSEGGWIAPHLAHLSPETKAVLIFGGAGAWKFKDEIALILKKNGSPLTDEEIESQFQKMKDDPSPQKFWLSQTYKFWAKGADLCNRDDILNLSCPVYLSIGSEDDCIESSDELWSLIQKQNKPNVTYARYEGLTHNMLDDRYTVLQDALRWIENQQNLESNVIHSEKN